MNAPITELARLRIIGSAKACEETLARADKSQRAHDPITADFWRMRAATHSANAFKLAQGQRP